ncbi:MAG: hypothetical protein U0031_17500 [Thermomicrobiales bacterium]
MSAIAASADLERTPRLTLLAGAASDRRMLLFRWLAVGCQIATIIFTWPLWTNHESPPMLPAIPLPAVEIGLPLVAASIAIVLAPRAGLITYSLLLLYAIVVDQTRLQPEVISLLILVWGTLPSMSLRAIARAHLVALWFFSGFNKLLSPAFFAQVAPFLLSAFVPKPSEIQGRAFGLALATTEMSLGILSLIPKTRRIAAWLALALHTGILITLSPLGHDHNSSVWPWNVALALAGFAYIAPWQGAPLAAWRLLPIWTRAVVVVLLLSPFGFYAGKIDAYLSHNLYSASVAQARVKCPVECQNKQDPLNTWYSFNVPLPPEHRLFEMYFARTCQPGDQMMIVDPRWWFQHQGLGTQYLVCQAGP